MSLYEALSAVQDPRRKQGQRTNLQQLLVMMIVSNLCGHFGGRAMARFSKAYESTFSQLLALKHPVPSHVIFSDLLNRMDSEQVVKAFNTWAANLVNVQEIRNEQDAAFSIDGKSLKSTMQDYSSAHQDFQAVVSVFAQRSGLVYAMQAYHNGQKSELNVVRHLIKQLKGLGMTLYLDALHSQKKQ